MKYVSEIKCLIQILIFSEVQDPCLFKVHENNNAKKLSVINGAESEPIVIVQSLV